MNKPGDNELLVTLVTGETCSLTVEQLIDAAETGGNLTLPQDEIQKPRTRFERLMSARYAVVQGCWPDCDVPLNDQWIMWVLNRMLNNIDTRLEQPSGSDRRVIGAYANAMLIISDPLCWQKKDIALDQFMKTLDFLGQRRILDRKRAEHLWRGVNARTSTATATAKEQFTKGKHLLMKALSPDSDKSMDDLWLEWTLMHMILSVGARLQKVSSPDRRVLAHAQAAVTASHPVCWEDKEFGLRTRMTILPTLGHHGLLAQEEAIELWREAVEESQLESADLGLIDAESGKPRMVDLENEEVNFVFETPELSFITARCHEGDGAHPDAGRFFTSQEWH